jgi:glutamine synthetase
MQDLRIDRLSLALRGLIFYGMKKARYTAPTVEELYALDKRARRERARHIAVLLRRAAAALKSVHKRVLSALTAKVVRHA